MFEFLLRVCFVHFLFCLTTILDTVVDDSAKAKDYLAYARASVPLFALVNNQYRKRSVENYREEYTQLLQQAIVFAKGVVQNVFVLSIPAIIQCDDLTNLNDFLRKLQQNKSMNYPIGFLSQANFDVVKRYLRGNIIARFFNDTHQMLTAIDDETIIGMY